jgi:hypothetical protein
MDSLPDRLPLVIGVTGHRDLRDEDVPKLEQQVAAVIAGLRRDYLGGKDETPIIVLSALAEGADRLVARVALAQGAHLIAPLPLPLDEYRRDFEPGLKPGNMAEFDALLARAIAAPVMPLHGVSLETLRADRQKRAEQYRAVGIFIIQHCHVLLALWDGDDKDMAAGGSAEIVAFKRGGIPLDVSKSARASLDGSEIGPVIDIITPRLKETSSADRVAVRPWGKAVISRYRGSLASRAWRRLTAFAAHVLQREPADERSRLPSEDRRELETWESFEALIDLTRHFNRDAAALAEQPNGAARVRQSADYLFTDPEGGTVDGVDANKHAKELAPLWCRLYAIADTLALERQSQFKWDWKLLFVFGFVAFFCFAMFTHAGYVTKLFLGSYLATFILLVIIYVQATIGQHQERYLDYRALAEALRVAVYWRLLGIGWRYQDAKSGAQTHDRVDTDPIGMIANAYPIKQPSELAWVKVCLRSLERLDQAEGPREPRIDPVGHAIARRFWVHGQFAYFRRQGVRHNNLAETIQARSDILVLLSPFFFVPLLLLDAVHEWGRFDVKHAIIIVIGLLPGMAAAMTGYAERLALKAQARQYDRMRMLFGRAYELLPEKIDEARTVSVRSIYHELGVEAMREHAEWVAIYRQRPIQPPL